MYPELFTIPGINFTVPGYGAMCLIAFLGATFWMTHRASKVKADPDIVLNMGFIILIFSALGARTFYVIQYWDEEFAHNPAAVLNIQMGGFVLYGGIIGCIIPLVLYAWYKRLSIRLYADLMAPSILFGMGVGRIGCFLFGCCWGGQCPEHLPWAVHFPYGSPPYVYQWQNRQVTVPAEFVVVDSSGLATLMPLQILKLKQEDLEALTKDVEAKAEALEQAKTEGDPKKITRAEQAWKLKKESVAALFNHFEAFDTSPEKMLAASQAPQYRTKAVHPVQLYAAVGPLLLALLTSAYFYRRKRHGMVMVLAMLLYPIQRFIEEIIRIDVPTGTFDMTISQLVSVVLFCAGVVGFFILQKLPLRSPKAIPCLPPGKKKERVENSVPPFENEIPPVS